MKILAEKFGKNLAEKASVISSYPLQGSGSATTKEARKMKTSKLGERLGNLWDLCMKKYGDMSIVALGEWSKLRQEEVKKASNEELDEFLGGRTGGSPTIRVVYEEKEHRRDIPMGVLAKRLFGLRRMVSSKADKQRQKDERSVVIANADLKDLSEYLVDGMRHPSDVRLVKAELKKRLTEGKADLPTE